MKAAQAALAALLVAGTVTFVPGTEVAAASNLCLTVGRSAAVDQLTSVDTTDPSPATNEGVTGTVGTLAVRSIATSPITKDLYAVDSDQLGVIDNITASWSPRPAVIGSGDGSLGAQLFENVDGLAFDANADLYGLTVRPGNDDDLLFQIDPATGTAVVDAFGAGIDYLAFDNSLLPAGTDLTEIAYDSASDAWYGIGLEPSGVSHFVELNLVSATMTVIGIGPLDVSSLAFDASGTAWALSKAGLLYQLNIGTGSGALVTTLDDLASYDAVDCGPADLSNNSPVLLFSDASLNIIPARAG